MEDFREWLIDEKDWSRKYLNKQAGRVVRMFKWAAAKQLVDASTYQELASLSGLKKGRTGARETSPVQPVATLTTVGYGDIVPVTAGGRAFTIFMLVIGLGVGSVPAGIIATALNHARQNHSTGEQDPMP